MASNKNYNCILNSIILIPLLFHSITKTGANYKHNHYIFFVFYINKFPFNIFTNTKQIFISHSANKNATSQIL